MRSLYAKILAWCLGVLLLAGFGFMYVSARAFSPSGPRRASPMGKLALFEMEQAIASLEREGKPGLAKYVESVDRAFDIEHHLAGADGRDILTGQDFSEIIKNQQLPPSESGLRWPLSQPPRFPRARASQDGRYHWVTIGPPFGPLDPWSFVPYYLVLLAGVVFLLWLMASRLVSPLRELANAMDGFGRGNLDVRSNIKRGDEIGSLSDSFNQMTERIRTLLVAERRLLQDVSHELRSPLARLSFAARLARTSPDREAAIDRIKNEIDRLTELVSSLIEVTRAEGDPNERPRDLVNLSRLVENVTGACKLDAQSKGCTIRYSGPEGATLSGNAELLRRAFENILRNGIRYAPTGSSIDVRLETEGAEATVSIRDNGPGVPSDKLDRLFEPFFRVEASRDSAEGGVGLGLAIARRAVSVHNGTLRAENAFPGLRVIVNLPLSQSPVSAEEPVTANR